MGRVGILAALAARDAWRDAGLSPEELRGPHAGVAFGSTAGSVQAEQEFMQQLIQQRSLVGLQSSQYLQFMTHTCAANLAVFAGVQGPVIATCSACTSGSQAVGVGYPQILLGGRLMLAGAPRRCTSSRGAIFHILAPPRARRTRVTPRPSTRIATAWW
jgi:3-oxoacyl-[acyl-carrier-protein] synthase II